MYDKQLKDVLNVYSHLQISFTLQGFFLQKDRLEGAAKHEEKSINFLQIHKAGKEVILPESIQMAWKGTLYSDILLF